MTRGSRLLQQLSHVALAILETPESRSRLARTGHRIIEERISRGKRFIYNDTPEKISHWVDAFLREIRSDFPNLYLTNIVRGEARMRKFSWGNDIKKYNAKTAGILQVNKMVKPLDSPDSSQPVGQLFKCVANVDILLLDRRQHDCGGATCLDVFENDRFWLC